MKGTILVTGATGFIGRYLVRQLVGAGASVRVFVRQPAALDPRIAPHVRIVQGDLCDSDSVREALRGADTVLHLAACAQAWARDSSVFTDANVAAVDLLLETAETYGVRRLVHVSTALTCPLTQEGGAGVSFRSLTPYVATKLEGERRVEEYVRRGHHAVIVHPTRVYGPGPLNDANGVTRLVDLYLRGRFRVRIADGNVRANYVHAADVAWGIARAAERGRPGGHYVLGGSNVSMQEFLQLVTRISGVRRTVVPLPPAVALAVAHAACAWGRLGGHTSLTPDWVRVFLNDLPFDVRPARVDLDYRPRNLETGLRETIAWLRTGRGGPVDAVASAEARDWKKVAA